MNISVTFPVALKLEGTVRLDNVPENISLDDLRRRVVLEGSHWISWLIDTWGLSEVGGALEFDHEVVRITQENLSEHLVPNALFQAHFNFGNPPLSMMSMEQNV